MKALCIENRISFPYVHDLARLITLLEGEEISVPDEVREAARLTRYAITTRYPGLDEPVSEQDYERAVRITNRVVEWVSAQIEDTS